MRVLLVGHGRMGKLVEQLSPEHGATVIGVVSGPEAEHVLREWNFDRVDCAIDFTLGDAVATNLPLLIERGVNVVIGTTGWGAHEPRMRELVARRNVGVLADANFSLAMNIFQLLVSEAARRFAPQASFGAWIHEWHHAAKKDAPSGTALRLKSAFDQVGYPRPVAVSSSRAGSIPGTHEVGFDGPADTVTLTHTVRDRAVFAHGALEAAKWLAGKRGWFTMKDMLETS
jgi:4-hydroxy-tetrahydrodipicolinate reductase